MASYDGRVVMIVAVKELLNQARAGRRPARAWFLRIASVRELLYACVSAPEAINN